MKTLLLAGLLACGSAWAADQTIAVAPNAVSTTGIVGSSPLLDGGNDLLTFAGLADGTYNYRLSLAALGVNDFSFGVDGQQAAVTSQGDLAAGVLSGQVTVTQQSFAAVVTGATTRSPYSTYFGTLQVALVPEPASLALLAIGLGAIGLVRGRRREA